MFIIGRLAGHIARLRAFHMLGLAFGLGLLIGFFGHAPWRFLPIFALCLPVLVWMLDGMAETYSRRKERFRRGFWLGSLFGLGYFLAGFYWVGYAFFATPVMGLSVLAPFGVFGLAAFFAPLIGLAIAACLCIWPQGWQRFLSLAFFWAIAEWARGFIATGFPWNLPAQSWFFSDALAQNFSWLGPYGATWMTIAAAASFAALGISHSPSRPGFSIKPALVSLCVFFALWAGGAWRLSSADENQAPRAAAPEIIIIQPHIAQRDKWNPHLRAAIIKKYLMMSKKAFTASKEKKKIMIWPEAALPVNIERSPLLRAKIADIIPKNAFLLAGLLRFDQQHGRAFNSIYLITDEGRLLQAYDKIHLVPFGEYLPAQSFLESLGLRQLTGRRGGFAAGTARALQSHQGSPPVAPLICYEIIFPHEIPGTATRPDWLVNVTNDGWYGLSSGPHQHFDLARARAIEQGLPVIRAANTGISAIIDSYGRIMDQQKLGEEGIVRALLPPPLPSTFYAQWRDWLFILILATTAILLSSRMRSRKYNY